MIRSKEDLKHYMNRDALADGHDGGKPAFVGGWPNTIWKYKVYLRKAEYNRNCSGGLFGRIIGKWYMLRYTQLGIKLGYTIPLNVCEEGLSLPHYGTIIINGNSHIGKNCRIMADVCVGSTSGVNIAATIGDNVYLGAGAKIMGQVKIGDDVMVGANAVITEDVESGVTVAGVPAKVISLKNSRSNLSKKLFQ